MVKSPASVQERVQQLMRGRGSGPFIGTSGPAIRDWGHRGYSYLLQRMNITRPNPVGAADITYMPTFGDSSAWQPEVYPITTHLLT